MAEGRIVGYVPPEGSNERTKLLRLKVIPILRILIGLNLDTLKMFTLKYIVTTLRPTSPGYAT